MFYLFISTFSVELSMGSITHHGKGGPWPEPSGIWGALSCKILGIPGLEDTPMMQLVSLQWHQVWRSQRWSHRQLYSLLWQWQFGVFGPCTALQFKSSLQSPLQSMKSLQCLLLSQSPAL